MKIYHNPSSLRIVGKGYEVRWQLRRLLETSKQPRSPLSERLEDWQPADRKLSRHTGMIPFPRPKSGAKEK